jgi:hypothetical protein
VSCECVFDGPATLHTSAVGTPEMTVGWYDDFFFSADTFAGTVVRYMWLLEVPQVREKNVILPPSMTGDPKYCDGEIFFALGDGLKTS